MPWTPIRGATSVTLQPHTYLHSLRLWNDDIHFKKRYTSLTLPSRNNLVNTADHRLSLTQASCNNVCSNNNNGTRAWKKVSRFVMNVYDARRFRINLCSGIHWIYFAYNNAFWALQFDYWIKDFFSSISFSRKKQLNNLPTEFYENI